MAQGGTSADGTGRTGSALTGETVAVPGAGGTMGFAMARNIARAGISIRAWDRTRGKAEPLADDAGRQGCRPGDRRGLAAGPQPAPARSDSGPAQRSRRRARRRRRQRHLSAERAGAGDMTGGDSHAKEQPERPGGLWRTAWHAAAFVKGSAGYVHRGARPRGADLRQRGRGVPSRVLGTEAEVRETRRRMDTQAG
jgi:NAD binding domain of 6-phosphogluconate dehydrogenase